MKIVAIVQARMNSSRLPGKIMKKINGEPVLGLLLNRLKSSKKISKIVVATSKDKNNSSLIKYLKKIDYDFYEGSEENVLERYFLTAKKFSADIIIRITGDCPLIDASLVDNAIDKFFQKGCEYLSNANPPTYPDGLDIEIFSFERLEEANNLSNDISEREHVTPFIKKNNAVRKFNVKNSKDFSQLRWTIDEPEDFEVISNIFNHFHPRVDFGWKEVLNLYKINPEIFVNNLHIKRNEGEKMKKGQKLWKRAKKVIPGGNMLLSKRPEMFLPELWPSYFSKSKGCKVWDLDNIEYIDMSIMGIGTNILGYGHEEVDRAVGEAIKNGNMSTLNCPEEVLLAEKLVEINPWSEMVRFARTGGEANAIAIRIARAASGKDNVAICGYHGWHDWYLAANIKSEDELKSHLLSGLEANGVPKQLSGTVFPFEYNDFEGLKKIIENENIGVIKMEVIRNQNPKNDFLQKVRKIATKKGIVLIFDECTSGFRETFGGIYQKYNVEPDMAMYGKALGNGYSITAIVGKKAIMEAAQNSFISSTFWTERIGPSAALMSLEIMQKINSWTKISNTGEYIKKEWHKLSSKYEVDIEILGISALPSFVFKSKKHQVYKTFITQEMLKKGFIANNSVYVCIEHTKELVDQYISELDKVFLKIKDHEDGKNTKKLLKGPVSHKGFERLN